MLSAYTTYTYLQPGLSVDIFLFITLGQNSSAKALLTFLLALYSEVPLETHPTYMYNISLYKKLRFVGFLKLLINSSKNEKKYTDLLLIPVENVAFLGFGSTQLITKAEKGAR